ncbi:MAG: YdbL family protein [Ectothiorhodospiraceae bacterium]
MNHGATRPFRALSGIVLLTGLALSACVTINVYFPAVAAEQAADRIIRDVWREQQETEPDGAEEGDGGGETSQRGEKPAAIALLEVLVPTAAAAQPDIDINSPAIRRLTESMEQRHGELKPYFDSGAIGLTNNGRVAIRDQSAIPLRERNQVRQLVADDNDDRDALYREIARANDHPEWEDQIRETFAERWIANAQDGWYYQNANGEWQQK